MQPECAQRAHDAARVIIDRLDYVGVLCIEFFILDDGSLVVNEMAPRPHNSGHYTIDACLTSQFAQQVRAMAGLALGDVRQHSPAVMLNLLGDLWFDIATGDVREPAAPVSVWRCRARSRMSMAANCAARAGRARRCFPCICRWRERMTDQDVGCAEHGGSDFSRDAFGQPHRRTSRLQPLPHKEGFVGVAHD